MKKKLLNISLAVLNVSAIIFGLTAIANELIKVSDIKAAIFGPTEVITNYWTTGKEPVHFKSWYQSVEDVIAGSSDFAKAAEAEGAVLLKNNTLSNGKKALPLEANKDKVSLFGAVSYNPMYSLDGAGGGPVNNDIKQFYEDEFIDNGLAVNNDLAVWYKSNTNAGKGYTQGNNTNYNINEVGWNSLPEAKNNSEYKTAVYTIGRMTNEGIDLPPYSAGGVASSSLTDNDYLKLTGNEISILKGLKAAKDAGTFDRIVVLFNTGNTIMDNVVDNPEYGIDAAMWVGFTGVTGISAVADLLTNVSTPSGRLPTTWFTNQKEHPSWNNFGNYNGGSSQTIYQEGVYVGYKYAETRYEDYVLNSPNHGNYDYDQAVNYTFGYGLSYATFEQEFVSLANDTDPVKNYDFKGQLLPAGQRRKPGDDLLAKVKVTNTSDTYSGKEVVQLYVQQPFDASNTDVEIPSVELIAFGKTKKLAPGESEVVEIKIDANKYFAAFDRSEQDYIVPAGKYFVTAASDAHNAVNNILVAKNKAASERMVGTGNASLVKEVDVSEDYSNNYVYWTHGGAKVTNLFDHADPNIADPDGNKIKFLSRRDWAGTVSSTSQSVSETSLRKAGRRLDNNGDFANAQTNYPYYENEYPTYGKELETHLNLIDLKGVEYEDSRYASDDDKAKWEDFMDQLTWDETVTIVANGRRMTYEVPSIGKPRTNDENASNGIHWKFNPKLDDGNANSEIGLAAKFDPKNRNKKPVGYPCPGIVAASFNQKIAYVVGQSIGEDALWAGASGLYGYGLNLHRNPYHGRAGEYYSEDAYLTGIMAGWASKGSQEKGLYVYNKHFVLNDQEIGRSSYATWIPEQALRQEHLRPFEIAIEIGDAMCVMTAFSRIGTVWSGNDHNLMTKWLRGEAGMRGFAVTDWYKSTGMGMRNGVLAGQDLPDGSASGEFSGYGPDNGGHGYLAQAMRTSAQRILYTVANSNAMNFIGDDTVTEITTIEPESLKLIPVINLTVNVTFAVALILATGMSCWNVVSIVLSKKKEEN